MRSNHPTNSEPEEEGTPTAGTSTLNTLARRARTTLIVLTAMFLAGLVGHLHWIADLFAHFVVHVAAVTLGCAIILLIARWTRWSAAAAVLFAAELVVMAPYLMGSGLKAAPSGDKPALRVLQFNIGGESSDWRNFIDWLRPRVDSLDVIVLLENTPNWQAAVELLKREFPEHVEEVRSDSSGIAVFSRLPGSNLKIRYLGQSRVPAVELRAYFGVRPITLIAAHTYPPLGKYMSDERNDQLHELAKWMADAPTRHKILLGDLNVTPFSPWFRRFLESTNLIDAQYELGLLPTWAPGPFPTVLGLPIDHTLISTNLGVTYRSCAARFGSDHCPVITVLRSIP